MKYLIQVIYPAEKVIHLCWEVDYSTEDVLEMVFARFNNGSGMECKEFIGAKIRSLSVNDIVKVNERVFQCLSFGWREITEQNLIDLENKVRNHPKYISGPWFALSEVMWNNK